MLLASGDAFAAAELLAGGDLAAIEALDVLEFQAAVDRLPDEAVEAHPALLLNFAISLETAHMEDQRRRSSTGSPRSRGRPARRA